MKQILTGQVLLIFCSIVYLIWWYRGFRPGGSVSRVGGMNGVLLLITAVLGIAGVIFSLLPDETMVSSGEKIAPAYIIGGGILAYVVLLLVTRYCFNRIVTSELMLIVGWTMLEVSVINRLNAMGVLSDGQFLCMCLVIAAAFVISMILYVAYYKMEEMKAFYAAMVPLVTEGLSMAVLVGIVRAL